MDKKKILILVFNSLKDDVRVKRQIRALKMNYAITAVCYESYEEEGVEFIITPPKKITFLKKALVLIPLALRWYKSIYKFLFRDQALTMSLKKRDFDLVISNDIETLPLAFELDIKKVVFDAHEYAPRHFEDRLLWRMFYQGFNTYLCAAYLSKLSGMMTVGLGLAKEYEKNFEVRPTVITNADNFIDLKPTEVRKDKIRLVHHGIANPSRKIEGMIEMVNLLDERFTLDLYLLAPRFSSGSEQYLSSLKRKYKGNSKVRILPPVKSSEIVEAIHQYDIGVFLLPPSNFNYENALPNKLFNFIQARLGVAVGPTPEMAAIVKQFNIGVVSNDFSSSSLAIELNKLTHQQVSDFKTNACIAAKELNAEKNALLINDLVSTSLT
jgi:hypothetical protein